MYRNIPYPGSPYDSAINRSMDHSRSTHRFNIISLNVGPARPEGYNNMVHRSFTSQLGLDTKQRIVEDVIRFGKVSNNTNSTSNVVRIGGTPIADAKIQGGWQAPRFTFTLTVRCTPVTDYSGTLLGGDTYDLVISGYSDPSDSFVVQNLGGGISPNLDLVFHINGVQRITINPNIKSITSINTLGLSTPENITDYATECIRPADVVSDIRTYNIANQYSGSTYNVGAKAGLAPMVFGKEHAVGKSYINSIINAVCTGIDDNTSLSSVNNSFENPSEKVYSSASYTLDNNTIRTDPFFLMLQQAAMKGQLGGIENAFTVRTLQLIDPTFNHSKINYANVTEQARFQGDGFSLTAVTEYLHGTSRLHAKVTELHNIIMSMLTSNLLGAIDIHIWNKLHTENFVSRLVPIYQILNMGWAYNTGDNRPETLELIKRSITGYVTTMIDPMLSENGNLEYDVHIVADVAADTTIRIKLGYEQEVIYRFPTFADMTYTPMITNTDVRQALTSNIAALTNELTDTLIHSAPGRVSDVDYAQHITI